MKNISGGDLFILLMHSFFFIMCFGIDYSNINPLSIFLFYISKRPLACLTISATPPGNLLVTLSEHQFTDFYFVARCSIKRGIFYSFIQLPL